MIDFPEVIDNSMLKDFRACPQKAFRAYFEHWKSNTQNVNLVAGGAFAHGLEVARRAFYEEGQDPASAVAEGIRGLLERYGDFQCPDDSPKSAIRMAQALEFYFDQWPLGEDKAVPMALPSGKRAIEFLFVEPIGVKHPVTNQPILYAGRSDMIAEMASGLFVTDEKTTKSLGASWSDQWDLDSQFTGYVWASRTGALHIPVDGVLVRGIGVLKTRFDKAQYITYRAPWEVDRWYEQVIRDVRRMIRCWEQEWFDFNLGTSCSNYGGCAFRQVCKAANPQDWLGMYFQRRRWDPVTRTETLLETPQ